MIARLHGTLVGLEKDHALVEVAGSGLTYEVLVPAFAYGRLGGSIDQAVTLHTLHFLESQNQGNTLLPRLAGFLSVPDKRFYGLLISCKGIGYRKGLRAMSLPSGQIAAAIADRDLKTLQSLPEIGKRSAEGIVLALREKVEPFLGGGALVGGDGEAPTDQPSSSEPSVGSFTRDALEGLTQLGENRADALERIERIMESDDPPMTADQLIAAVYASKG